MKIVRQVLPIALVLLAASACTSAHALFSAQADVPGSVRVADVAVPEAVRPMVLTVYPTPRHVEYGDLLLPLAGAVVLDDTAPDFDERVRASGLDLGWKEMPPEGYVLHVTAEDGHA